MSRPKVPIRGRGGVHASLRARLAERRSKEQAYRDAAVENPYAIFSALRVELDAKILDAKRKMAAAGYDRTHVLLVCPNPRIPAGSDQMMIALDFVLREEVAAIDDGPECAEARATLAHPPKPGHVWLYIPIPHHRMLVEEPFEHSVATPTTTAPGGEA